MNNELMAMLEYLEQEREISREDLFTLIEEALTSSARKEMPAYDEPYVKVDRKSGELTTYATFTVVDEVGDNRLEITEEDAREHFPDAENSDELEIPFHTTRNLTRIAAQTTKQVIMQKLRQMEKERVVEEFSDHVGELITGVVRQWERGEIIVDFGRAEGGLQREDRVPGEDYQNGDHITVLLKEIDTKRSGPSLVISRSHPDLIRLLLEREVSEIHDDIVTIKKIAREPGFRTKVAVECDEPNVDPVGACIGIRGTRIKAILRELNREKLDIIQWSEDTEELIREALKPAELQHISIDETTRKVKVITNDDQYSLAVGRKGQNARLACRITGYEISIEKGQVQIEEDSNEERLQRVILTFLTLPHIDLETAKRLTTEGYLSLDGILEAGPEELALIEGIDSAQAEDIIASIQANRNS